MIARHIIVAGRVQGVFFRDWTVRRAQSLGITGWVRNRRDGRVEIYAVAPMETMDAFVAALHDGSPASRVDKVDVTETDLEPMTGFRRTATA